MIRSNVIAGAVCFGFGAFVFWLAQSVPPVTLTDTLGGRFFPQLISILFMLASVGLFVTGLAGVEVSGGTVTQADGRKGDKPVPTEEAELEPRQKTPSLGAGEVRLIAFIATMLIYTLILPYLGYLVASSLVFAVMIVIAGERRPIRVALGAAGITGLLYTLFGIVFKMNLPTASLF